MGDSVMRWGGGILVLLEGSVVGGSIWHGIWRGGCRHGLSAARYKGPSLLLFGGIHEMCFQARDDLMWK